MEMKQLPKAEKLGYSIVEACAATSLGKTTIYAHIAAGRLKMIKIGGRTIIPFEALMAFLKGDDVPTTSHPASDQCLQHGGEE